MNQQTTTVKMSQNDDIWRKGDNIGMTYNYRVFLYNEHKKLDNLPKIIDYKPNKNIHYLNSHTSEQFKVSLKHSKMVDALLNDE